MTNSSEPKTPKLSILERLISDTPDLQTQLPGASNRQTRLLHQSVRRDLENLLNTRQPPRPWPRELKELEDSLLSYGLPDFTTMNLSTANGRETFRQIMESVIRHHEPRLKSVNVLLLDNAEPLDRSLRFHIDALLQMDPTPERIEFDTRLEPISGNFSLKESGYER